MIIKSFNTLCTIKTGWPSGNKHSFISVVLKLLVQFLVYICITNILLYFTIFIVISTVIPVCLVCLVSVSSVDSGDSSSKINN